MTHQSPVWDEEARAAVREALVRCGQRYDQNPTTGVDTRTMFAPPAHEVALAFDRPLIVGGRGTGKSYWAAALCQPEARDRLMSLYPRARRSLQDTRSFQGFAGRLGTENSPFVSTADELLELVDRAPADHVWRAVLCRYLADRSDATLAEIIAPAREASSSRLGRRPNPWHATRPRPSTTEVSTKAYAPRREPVWTSCAKTPLAHHGAERPGGACSALSARAIHASLARQGNRKAGARSERGQRDSRRPDRSGKRHIGDGRAGAARCSGHVAGRRDTQDHEQGQRAGHLSWYLPEVLTKCVPVPRACEGGARMRVNPSSGAWLRKERRSCVAALRSRPGSVSPKKA